MILGIVRLVLLITFFLNIPLSYAIERNHVREEKKNMLGTFQGGTYTNNRNFYTFGFEYHRVISLPFGFSVIAEDTPNNIEGHHEGEIIGLATLNALKNVTVGLGPGIQLEKGKPVRLLGRVSMGYIFLVGNDIEITPGVDFNWIQKNPTKLLYGITLGKQFD